MKEAKPIKNIPLYSEEEFIGSISSLVTRYLSFGEKDEVSDNRVKTTFEDRVKVFADMWQFLSDAGKDCLNRLRDSIRENNEVSLGALRKEFPSVENPHSEYFLSLLTNSKTELKNIFELLQVMQITKGCSHGCKHCY